MMDTIYLDHAATTPVAPEVIEAMLPFYKTTWGNPSTIYSIGRAAKKGMEDAREQVAALLNAQPDEVYFASGGTESDNFALIGALKANAKKGKHLIVSKIEHHAVLHTAEVLEKEGFDVSYVGVDRYGLVDQDELRSALRDDTVLVSIMHSNNEIGTIQPLKELVQIVKEKGALFHTDAVQSVGSVPIDVKDLGIDLLTLSAHKQYGPKGIGGLYVKKGTRISPILHGGSQERRRRPGTENVPGIVGFGACLELAGREMDARMKKASELRDHLIDGLMKVPDVRLNGHPTERLPNNVNICFERIEGEGILLFLDQKGICASSGSACTSATLEPSHVLLACGLTHEVAHGSVRFTLGKSTTKEQLDKVIETVPPIVERLRSMSPIT